MVSFPHRAIRMIIGKWHAIFGDLREAIDEFDFRLVPDALEAVDLLAGMRRDICGIEVTPIPEVETGKAQGPRDGCSFGHRTTTEAPQVTSDANSQFSSPFAGVYSLETNLPTGTMRRRIGGA